MGKTKKQMSNLTGQMKISSFLVKKTLFTAIKSTNSNDVAGSVLETSFDDDDENIIPPTPEAVRKPNTTFRERFSVSNAVASATITEIVANTAQNISHVESNRGIKRLCETNCLDNAANSKNNISVTPVKKEILTNHFKKSSGIDFSKNELKTNKKPKLNPTSVKNSPLSARSLNTVESAELESILNLDLSNCDSFDENFSLDAPNRKEYLPDDHIRYKVSGVDITLGEKQLTLKPINTANNQIVSFEKKCILRGFWADSNVIEGDIIHIIGDCNDCDLIVDNQRGLLVIEPDKLIASTAIVSTLFCFRKSVLSERFKGLDAGNKAMMIGCLVHQIFQEAVEMKSPTLSDLELSLKRNVTSSKNLHDLLLKGLDTSDIYSTAESYLPHIFDWIKKYQKSTSSSLVSDNNIKAQITNISDIEDNLWCTTLGVKGKIDVTVDVNIHKGKQIYKKILPLELKTGKSSFSIEHQGQLSLYSMMMNQRGQEPGGGLLLYLSDGPKMKLVEDNQASFRGLIQMRNELMRYFEKKDEREQLPDPISKFDLCRKCPFALPCSLMEVSIEGKEVERSTKRKDLVTETLKHLTSSHISYFEHWYKLLQLESVITFKKNNSSMFWNEDSVLRETKGTCFSQMTLQSSDLKDETYLHKFVSLRASKFNLMKIGFQLQDTVVVSSEVRKADLAIAIGFVVSVTEDTLILTLDKDLCKRPNRKKETFRIDKHSSMSFTAINYKNVIELMMNTPRSDKLRSLIIDMKEPTFLNSLKRGLLDEIKPIIKNLNKTQQRAIFKALMANDYVLLRGMPGTGKTSTIVALVRLLVILGKSVLLTSYTHSAVDNILLKLKSHNAKFIRLGKMSRVHPQLIEYTPDILASKIKTVAELKHLYNSAPIIATTCLSVNHAALKHREFDFCIVDEGSQVLQPACLGPLFLAKSFILVGDSKQLPPLAQSSKAKEFGICESLFSRLESDISVMELTIQYRMNSEIMKLCNELTYCGKLECGNDQVASATLISKSLVSRDNTQKWLSTVLSTDLKDSVVFLDTKLSASKERKENNGYINHLEAEIIKIVTTQLINTCKLTEDNFGIISPYRNQVNLLKSSLISNPNIEVSTVDQFQGRDKSVVIFSCVKSNSKEEPSQDGILQDANRLNVAITRAKHKLVIVGNSVTLKNYKPFYELLNLLKIQQIVTLPESL